MADDHFLEMAFHAIGTMKYICYISPMICSLSPIACSIPPITCSVSPIVCSVCPISCSISPIRCSACPMMCSTCPIVCSVFPIVCFVSPIMCSVIPIHVSTVRIVKCQKKPLRIAAERPFGHGWWPLRHQGMGGVRISCTLNTVGVLGSTTVSGMVCDW